MKLINNKIYVIINKDNKAILKFLKCDIETKAYIGRNGATIKKREGDGKTPLGEFEFGIILSKHPEIRNKNGIKCVQINKNMYWVDNPNSRYYNKLVNILEVDKDWNSAEHLIDYPIQYEYLIEIKTNPSNIKGKGSAIFLHCTNNLATAGCVAIEKESMKKIIENLDNNTKIEIYKNENWL